MWLIRRSALSFFLALALLFPAVVFAQTDTKPIDSSRLQYLYQLYLQKSGSDPYLEKLIAEERSKIRKTIADQVNAIIEKQAGGALTDGNLAQAYERQRSLVSSLLETEREREVDLDLLEEEERKYYLQADGDSAPIDQESTTRSYPELLAKKAILEEWLSVLQSTLTLQNERLSRLKNQQLLEQFGAFYGLATHLGIIVIAFIVNTLIQRAFISRIEPRNRRYFAVKVTNAIVYGFALLIILSKILADHPNALASIAIVGAGIAIALQDIVKDFVGWLMILQKRHVNLGDRVSVDGHTGDIMDIGIFSTAMMEVGTPGGDVLERTGKTLYVPNALFIGKQVLNYNTTSDFSKAEMQVMITYESDWRSAHAILKEILKEETAEFTEQARKQHTRRTHLFYVSKEPTEAHVYTDLASSGVLFTLRFHVPIGRRRDVISAISKKVLREFKREAIELAYNTVRSFSTNVEASKK